MQGQSLLHPDNVQRPILAYNTAMASDVELSSAKAVRALVAKLLSFPVRESGVLQHGTGLT